MLEQETKLQQLALQVLQRSQATSRFVSPYAASMKRLLEDRTFREELTNVSHALVAKDDSAGGADQGGQTWSGEGDSEEKVLVVLPAHRKQLLPVLLRILFSKLTKRGVALDKHSSQQTRRNAVFVCLAGLNAEEMFELLAVMLSPILTVLGAEDGGAEGAPSRLAPIRISEMRRSAAVRRLLEVKGKEDSGLGKPVWISEMKLWAWEVVEKQEDNLEKKKQRLYVTLDLAQGTRRRWVGFLSAFGEVATQMEDKVAPFAPLFMELLCSMLEHYEVQRTGDPGSLTTTTASSGAALLDESVEDEEGGNTSSCPLQTAKWRSGLPIT